MVMEILPRADALAAGAPRYFTGRACKAGHLTYRYTTSGACSGCVAAARDQGRSLVTTPRAPREEAASLAVEASVLAAFRSQSTTTLLRVHANQERRLYEIVEAYNIARWPELPAAFYAQPERPKRREAGTVVFEMRCHEDDVAALHAECSKIMSDVPVRPFDLMERAKTLGLDAEDETTWPQGDPR